MPHIHTPHKQESMERTKETRLEEGQGHQGVDEWEFCGHCCGCCLWVLWVVDSFVGGVFIFWEIRGFYFREEKHFSQKINPIFRLKRFLEAKRVKPFQQVLVAFPQMEGEGEGAEEEKRGRRRRGGDCGMLSHFLVRV